MSYIIIGLGNPGEEYENTRHNSGRIVLEAFGKKFGTGEWKNDMKLQALTQKCAVGSQSVLLVMPETFMNKSGASAKSLIISEKKAENLIVVHDDLDLPLGSMKIVFNRGSGGHKGVESITRAIKTEKFTRLRIGICPTTPGGKLKKPSPEKITDFIVQKFKAPELAVIKKTASKAAQALEAIVAEGRLKAMTDFN